MFYSKLKDYFVIRLQKNEEIITSLMNFAKKNKIKGGFLYGLGVGEKLTLGYFDAHKRVYIKKRFKGEYEFTSMLGNIAYFDREPVVHIHVTITDAKFNAFGGHLFEAYVPATLEIIVLPFYRKLVRKSDKSTGLKLLDL
ncbi:MAG: PPC domain-containing DNA-binding protein [bacterium]